MADAKFRTKVEVVPSTRGAWVVRVVGGMVGTDVAVRETRAKANAVAKAIRAALKTGG